MPRKGDKQKTTGPRAAKGTPARARAKAKVEVVDAELEEEPKEPAEEELAEAAGLSPEPGAEEDPGEAGPVLRPEVLPAEEEPGKLAVPARDLSRADALQRYMAEVSRHPLLTREEEHELAVKFRETGDKQAAYRLATANLRLVVKIAHEYRRAAFSLLDLVQEGNVGLLQAVQKYDPYRGVKLSSYAAWWIRAYILKFILANWRLVKVGTTQAQRKLFFNLRKEREKLEKQGFQVEAKHLAAALDVTEQEVIDMERRLTASETSLDAPMRSDEQGERTQGDFVRASAGMRPDNQVESGEFSEILKTKLHAFGQT